MVNKGRLLNREGRSELASVAPIADGINKLATGHDGDSEFYQTPRRYATGIQMPGRWSGPRAPAGRGCGVLGTGHQVEDVAGRHGRAVRPVPGGRPQGFVAGIHLLTSALASIGGLPPDDLGLNQVNPASAEARRAAETVLVLRARRSSRRSARAYTGRCGWRLPPATASRCGPCRLSSPGSRWTGRTRLPGHRAGDGCRGQGQGIWHLRPRGGAEQVGMGPAERLAIKERAGGRRRRLRSPPTRARMALADELVRTTA
jgi:hypothetical protein